MTTSVSDSNVAYHVYGKHVATQHLHMEGDGALGPFLEALLQACLGPVVQTLSIKLPTTPTRGKLAFCTTLPIIMWAACLRVG